MNFEKKKTAFALTLMFAMAFSVVALPVAYAQGSWNWVTHTYIVVSPNPIGRGQSVNIIVWLDNAPPQINQQDYIKYRGWKYTITITDPAGKTNDVGPFESDSTGQICYVFTPDMVGAYKIQAHFEGATINITGSMGLMRLPIGIHTFQKSSSRVAELTVQEEQIEAWPDIPLPSGYWERPINAEFKSWYTIAGNWIVSGSYVNKYTTAPETPHIVWTKELTFGGIVGGEAGWGKNYYTGLLYENKFNPRIISGRLYYNMFWSGSGDQFKGVICVDLRTGQELWRKEDMPQISVAQIVIFDSGTQSGAIAYLWSASGSTWQLYDAYTGRLFTNVTGASGSLSSNFGPSGEILVPILDGANNRLVLWNSTLCFTFGTTAFSAQTYRPYSQASYNWKNGIQYNVSIPDVPGVQSTAITDAARGVLVAESVITMSESTPTFVHVGYNLNTGEQMWVKNWTNVGWGAGGTTSPGLVGYWGKGYGEGVYMFFEKETMQWHVIDITTGQQLYATDPLNEYTKSDYSVYDWAVLAADGKLFTAGQSGCVVAFDLKTGTHLWTFNQDSSGLMTPYGTWPHFGRLNYADGKVYFAVTEHTPTSPIFRGYRMYCLNAETSEKLWEIPGFYNGESVAFADGYLVTYNGYDNRIYCFGKGQTATEVSASPKIAENGDLILVEGKVIDKSPGAENAAAVADECMRDWMAYVYMQYPYPANVTGVEVIIEVLDPNGNYYEVARTTSDASGFFKATFEPPVPGEYTVIARFAGSESYFGSSAETAIVVEEAPSATPEATTAPQAPVETYLAVSTIAIIVAIVIVGFLILRKR